MALPRFFVEFCSKDAVAGSILSLSERDAHHASNVLRLLPLQNVVVVIVPDGKTFLGQICTVEKRKVTVTLISEKTERPSSSKGVTCLICPLLKGSRNEQIVDWATELGVERIVFWHATRSVVRIKPEDFSAKTARWQNIAEDGAKQCQGTWVPQVKLVKGIDEALYEHFSNEMLVSLSLGAQAKPLSDVPILEDPFRSYALILGPEGDLTPEEEETIKENGGHFLTLGTRVLRSELAAVSGLIILSQRGSCAGREGGPSGVLK